MRGFAFVCALVLGFAAPAAAAPKATKLDADLGEVFAWFWARDGESFYVSVRNALVRIDPETGDKTRLPADSSPESYVLPRALSASGERLVFSSANELVVLEVETGTTTRHAVAEPGYELLEPQWAADDQTVVALAVDPIEGVATIVTATPDAGGSKQLACGKHGRITQARLTGDGKQLVYLADGAVYVTDLACNKPKRMRFGEDVGWFATSPDGKLIAAGRNVGETSRGWRTEVARVGRKATLVSKTRSLMAHEFITPDALLVEEVRDDAAHALLVYSVKRKRLRSVVDLPTDRGCHVDVVATSPEHAKALLQVDCSAAATRSYYVLTL